MGFVKSWSCSQSSERSVNCVDVRRRNRLSIPPVVQQGCCSCWWAAPGSQPVTSTPSPRRARPPALETGAARARMANEAPVLKIPWSRSVRRLTDWLPPPKPRQNKVRRVKLQERPLRATSTGWLQKFNSGRRSSAASRLLASRELLKYGASN